MFVAIVAIGLLGKLRKKPDEESAPPPSESPELEDLPEAIRRRPPTTDTFSLPQSQEEFYFALPYDKMDLCLYGRNHGVPSLEVASALGLTAEQVERVFHDIDQKRRSTRYLHREPLLVHPVPEVAP